MRRPWTRGLIRLRRGAQLVAGLLIVLGAWQGWGLRQGHAAVAPQPPPLREAWFIPPGAVTPVRLERLAPVVLAAPAPTSAPLAAGPAAPRLTLQGIVFGETPRAYVVAEGSTQTLTVRPGDTLGPITITAIRERTVLIEQEGHTYELRL